MIEAKNSPSEVVARDVPPLVNTRTVPLVIANTYEGLTAMFGFGGLTLSNGTPSKLRTTCKSIGFAPPCPTAVSAASASAAKSGRALVGVTAIPRVAWDSPESEMSATTAPIATVVRILRPAPRLMRASL